MNGLLSFFQYGLEVVKQPKNSSIKSNKNKYTHTVRDDEKYVNHSLTLRMCSHKQTQAYASRVAYLSCNNAVKLNYCTQSFSGNYSSFYLAFGPLMKECLAICSRCDENVSCSILDEQNFESSICVMGFFNHWQYPCRPPKSKDASLV